MFARCAVLGVLGLAPSLAFAQTGWVAGPGTGSVSLNYQYTKVDYHLFGGDMSGSGGDAAGRLDMGQIAGQSLFLHATYVVLPNLSLNGSLAYVGGTYTGDAPESPVLDDGNFHGQMQDAAFGARYSLALGSFALSPFVGFSFPTHEYEHHGHVASGKGNNIFTAGASLSRSFYPIIPGGYTTISYSHDFVADVENWGLDGDRYGFDLGYFITPALSTRGYFSYYQVKDGIDWYDDTFNPTVWHYHDAAAATLQRRIGGAIYWQFNSDKTVFVDIGGLLSGENTHDGISYTFGTTWFFMAPIGRR
jgi:hypothetical protein